MLSIELAISKINNAFNVNFNTICSYFQNDKCKIYNAIIKVTRNSVKFCIRIIRREFMLYVRH